MYSSSCSAWRSDVVEDVRRVPRHRQRVADSVRRRLARVVGRDPADAGLVERLGQVGVVETRVLAGDQLGRVDREALALREVDVGLDLALELGEAEVVEVLVVIGVVRPAEAAPLLDQRLRKGVARVLALDAVVDEIEAHAGRHLPGRGPAHVARGHPDRARALLGCRVRLHVPAVVRQEDIVDLQLEVVARRAEVDAAGSPGEHAVAQELRVDHPRVRVDRDDELLTTVRVGIGAHEGRAVRAADERPEAGRVDRRRLVAPGVAVEGESDPSDTRRAAGQPG